MAGRFALDTNIVIAVLENEPGALARWSSADEIFVSAVVLGELYFGARKSARGQTNVARIDRFASGSTILETDIDTAREYGDIKNSLQQKGRMIPDNDMWIAASALQYNLTLVTRDSHFRHVDGLDIESW
jgi:tRNA(fMet)-specific endonuclease VapC